MKNHDKPWYITLIAALYLVLCSISVVRYVMMEFSGSTGSVPVMVLSLCLGMAIAAGTYFVRPRVGHMGLVLSTIGALLAIGTTDPRATGFHLVVLCILISPHLLDRTDISPSAPLCRARP